MYCTLPHCAKYVKLYTKYYQTHSIIYLLKFWFADVYPSNKWGYGSTLSGTLSLLFSPSGTKALMRQFINTLFVGMAYTLSKHALAILMCLTLLNSFNRMKSFTVFTFSWLKFVKKRGTSIYLWRVYVMPSTLRIHCLFLPWHNLKRPIFHENSRIIGIYSIDKPWWFGNSRRGMTLLRRETLAFAQQKWSRWYSLSLWPLWIGSATSGICALGYTLS